VLTVDRVLALSSCLDVVSEGSSILILDNRVGFVFSTVDLIRWKGNVDVHIFISQSLDWVLEAIIRSKLELVVVACRTLVLHIREHSLIGRSLFMLDHIDVTEWTWADDQLYLLRNIL
jgi:hypothetical protein